MAVAVAAPERVSAPEDRRLDDERLLRRYHRDGDLDAREELVVRFMPLARQLASGYRHSGEPLDDLAQVACVGLLKAVDRYDPERGTGFTRYALPTMLGELKRHFRDKGWAVRVPRATQELALKVNEALGTLPAKLGRRAPARRGGGDRGLGRGRARGDGGRDRLRDRLAGRAARQPGDDEDWTHGDALGDDDPGYELVELGEALEGTLAALPARERLILGLRFERDLTQAEIASCVGISQMHVSRLLRRSLNRLSTVRAAAP